MGGSGHGRAVLRFDDRARKALSLLLIPTIDGGPVVAEKLFDQMEIYPGMRFHSDTQDEISKVG